MTDQELLALVQAKTPDELSLEEIDLLRTRLAESEELREALFGQMQMEGYLAEALGRVHFTPQDILARAHADQGRFQLTVPLVCVLLAVPIFLLLGTALWNAISPRQTEVARNNKPADKKQGKKTDDPKAVAKKIADNKNEKQGSAETNSGSKAETGKGSPANPGTNT